MTTLYRKYRPKNFSEVVNQNHIRITLEHQIQSDKQAHAYLFCGPRAVGKTTLARVLAKAVNCEKRKTGKSEPCNACPACESINAGRSLDIIEIDAASHTGVDNVRDNVIASARVAPANSKFKVFIIDEVHMLSISSFNALLKIIEEPPAYVIFILCTTEVHKVPTTIISRCQRFDFKRFSVSDIVKKLRYVAKQEGIKIDSDILEAIARNSEGHMRDAESLLGQVAAVGGKKITREEADLVIPRSDMSAAIDLLGCLAKKDAVGGIELINRLLNEGINLKQFSGDFLELLRKLLLVRLNYSLAGKFGLEWGENLESRIEEAGKPLNLAQLLRSVERFMRARNELTNYAHLRLPAR
jgi:DNA polymerase-3 subunit gamma/tau